MNTAYVDVIPHIGFTNQIISKAFTVVSWWEKGGQLRGYSVTHEKGDSGEN